MHPPSPPPLAWCTDHNTFQESLGLWIRLAPTGGEIPQQGGGFILLPTSRRGASDYWDVEQLGFVTTAAGSTLWSGRVSMEARVMQMVQQQVVEVLVIPPPLSKSETSGA